MAELRVTELDFQQIKQNLKTFLKGQTEFLDYDFDGAGLNVLLDVLSYNTHYNAMLAHLMSNEMFIDTAIKRSSVVSLAKMLGYIPQSYGCARATVTVSVPSTDPSVTLDTEVNFTSSVNNIPYTFNVETVQTVVPVNGMAVFENIDIIEGVRLQKTFTIASDNLSGPLVIPVENIDISTITVLVQTAPNVLTYTLFTRSTTVVDVIPTSKVFWIEENFEGMYQIVFGDNVIGQQLVAGNIVIVSYVACNGNFPNGCRTFSLNGTIAGTSNVSVRTISPAGAGGVKESIDSIRFNAPKYNATRNRAVTTQDYKSLIIADPHVGYKTNAVAVWGGEENIPPVYGKVYITIDPSTDYLITDSDKKYIIDKILRPRSVMSIQHEFVDPEFLHLGFEVVVSYNSNLTNLTSTDMSELVRGRIEDYFLTNLSTLDKPFFFSQFVDEITSTNSSILGAMVNMRIQNRVTRFASFNTTKNLRFLASLQPDSIISTIFVSSVNGISYDAFIKDFRDEVLENQTGVGTLKLLQSGTNTVLVADLGSVDYGTGILSFSDLNIADYLGNITDVRITAIPQALSVNISPNVISATRQTESAVFPAPAKNIVIKLDDSTIDTSIALNAGLTVTSIPYSGL